MPNIKQFCDNCRFYLPTEDDGKGRGECRRYPRQCSDSGDNFRRYFFSKVSEYDWCGEWNPILKSGNTSVYDEK